MSRGDRPQNPYRPPSSGPARRHDDPGVIPRPPGVLIVAVIETFVAFFASWMGPITISDFEELYRGFGGPLPGITRAVLATRYGWVIFLAAAIAILVWVGGSPYQTQIELRRKMLALTALALAFGIALGIAFHALYLPIIRMGQAI